MYLFYVDESGDPGLVGSPGRYFALSALAVHESRWRDLTAHLLAFRRTLKTVYNLPVRAEIHAGAFIKHPPVVNMQRHIRLSILRNFIDEICKIDYVSITNVIVDKQNKNPVYDVFENAWKTLFQRIENTIGYGNFPGGYRNDKGIVFVDNANGKKLRSIVRKMAVYNPIPNAWGGGYKQLPTIRIIEDPHGKDSADSYCVQACDTIAYFLYQKYSPNTYIRKNSAANYIDRLTPRLNTRASRTNPLGIVCL